MSVVGINAAIALMVHRARVYVPAFSTCLALCVEHSGVAHHSEEQEV